jgi:signal transduction histidine kinase
MITSSAIAVILSFSALFNWLFGLHFYLVLSSAVGSVIFSLLYLFGRNINRSRLFYWITSVLSLIYLNIIWFLNFASQGPILPLYVVLYAFLILVFDKKYLFAISSLLFANVGLLLAFELYFNDHIVTYDNSQTRIIDVYIGLIFSLLIIYTFVAAIKKNYIHQYERAKMSDHLKSAFLANMSHEIRTPLNAIVGFSSIINDPDIKEEDKRDFEIQIQKNSDYLLSLIEDIIDVSKIESNQLTVKIQKVNVVPLIDQITQSFQMTVPTEKNIQIINQIGVPELIVEIDKVRFEQILRNLLSNAVKFTDNGSIEVGCLMGREFYTFFVKDSGIGIHTEHLQIIFERFRKVDNSKQQLYRGTGIGLFLSRQLVELFGGKIWAESEVGKGSTFYFTIPV